MITSMIAWHRTLRSPLTTSTERERAFPLVCQRSVVSHHPHTHALWLKLNMFAPFTSSTCAWSFVRSLHLDSSFLFLAPHSALYLLPLVLEVCGKLAQHFQREYGLHRRVLPLHTVRMSSSLSVISPSPFSCFTRPCSYCSLTVISRPFPTSTFSLTFLSTRSCRISPTSLRRLSAFRSRTRRLTV